MADHLTQQISAAVLVKLTGLTTTGGNVFDGHPRQLAETSIPALVLEEGGEESEVAELSWPRLMHRRLQMVVRVFVKEGSPPATLRKIRKEVEVALGADPRLGGLTRDLRFTGKGAMELVYEADKPVGMLPLFFQIDYGCLENAPDVAQ